MNVPAPDPSTDAGGYDGYAAWKGWDALFTVSPEEAAYFAGEMATFPLAGARVLEIGFGSGAFMVWARDRGAQVAGTEVAPALVEAARDAGFEVLATDLGPAEDVGGTFDLIVALDVFEHLEPSALAAALAACAGRLAPGGRLLLRYPNGQSPLGLPAQHGDATHLQALSRAKVEQAAACSGLRTLSYARAFRPPGRTPVQRLVRWLRYRVQDALEAGLDALYRFDAPMAPVVVHVLVRD